MSHELMGMAEDAMKFDGGLDGFIDETVERVCPAPRVVSDTALEQLRPVFRELLNLRVLAEAVVLRAEAAGTNDADAQVTALAEAIRALRDGLRVVPEDKESGATR